MRHLINDYYQRFRFALATSLVQIAVDICPLPFANRFAEETGEVTNDKAMLHWEMENAEDLDYQTDDRSRGQWANGQFYPRG